MQYDKFLPQDSGQATRAEIGHPPVPRLSGQQGKKPFLSGVVGKE